MTVLYKANATGITGRAIARGLGMESTDGTERRPRNATDVLIRWGNSDNNNITDAAFPFVVNNHTAVALARNKEEALRAMARAGIRVPGFTMTPPCVGRSRFHQEGHDLRLFQRGDRVQGMDYYLEYLDIEDEYRVHVMRVPTGTNNFEIVATQRKFHPNDGEEPWPRNYNNGWRMQRIRERDWLSRKAIPAVQALGLDFGAVDLVHSNGHVYVLEINTGPALEGEMLTRYVDRLHALIEGHQPTPASRLIRPMRSYEVRERQVSFRTYTVQAPNEADARANATSDVPWDAPTRSIERVRELLPI